MIKKITVNNQDCKFTIDTYQTFTDDTFIEKELEYLNLEYNDLEFKYNNPEIVKQLSLLSLELLKDSIPDDSVIKNIELESTQSPKYYNYSTDSYNMVISYDNELLNDFIAKNDDSFKDYSKSSIDSQLDIYKITYYIDKFYNDDDYIMTMFEGVHEIYGNNVEIKLSDDITLKKLKDIDNDNVKRHLKGLLKLTL